MEGDNRSMVPPGRNSVEKATSSKTGEPHYLRASTGSCHDFCKFGRQHAFDAKERRSLPKRLKEVLASPEIKKTVVLAKPLSVSKSMDSGEKYSRSKSIIKREIVNDGKPLMVKARPSISSTMSNSDTLKAKVMKIPSFSRPKVNPSMSKSIKVNSSMSKSMKVNSSTSNNIGENTRPRRNRDVETGRIMGTSNIVASKKVLLSSPKVSLSPKPVDRIANLIARKQKSRKVVSPHVNSSRRTRKDESNKREYDEVEEKTLYVIKIETGKKPQFGCSSLSHDEGGDRDKGENAANEAEFESFSKIDDIKKVIDKKGSFKKVDSLPPSKLSFRRGKVVEIQSQANSPRRLKFRQARLLGENRKIGDPRRRNLKKVEEFECKSTTTGEKSEEKVVLRHQDMQGKKDSRGLFNNVIEETASKLVETRKSKVKALVGAFETVISLQEIKSSVR